MARKATRRLSMSRYSDEERSLIIDYLMALKASYIREFLEQHELAKSGTKDELRERVVEVLDEGDLTYPDLVRWIDQIEPWGKQHVYLFTGPEGRLIDNWRDEQWVRRRLEQYHVDQYFNAHIPLILPSELSLSSIGYSNNTVRIAAVERREYWERDQDKDEVRHTEDGEEVELRAFVHHVKRGMVSFEWNLTSNNAMLQISQLHRGTKYEVVRERFEALVQPWLDISHFSPIGLSRVIARLHEAEESGRPETRSHSLDWMSLGGRRLSGRSPSSHDSLLGEDVIDNAMSNIRRQGVGHLGNFYWLARDASPAHNNPLESEVHVYIVASQGRVAFPTPNTQEIVRYVLSRVRALSS